MTEREALKLALEALKYPLNQSHENFNVDMAELLAHRAITAIEEALAQPEQEPVAWRNAAIRVGEDLCSVGPFGYYDMTAEQWLDWALSVVTVHAPPPQRKPLTDEEIILIVAECAASHQHTDIHFARAIERAHGIKELV